MDAPNAADRKSIRKQEKAARLADIQRREVITSIMSTSPGRAWLWDRLSDCHIFHTTFLTDPYASAYQEGRRSVGLSLLADVMLACPDQYIQAMRESNERSIRPEPNPSDSGPASVAERRGSPLADGGDLGTEPDNGEADADDITDPANEPRWNPGADIYADTTGGKTS